MYEVGRACVKTCGRESGRNCLILDNIDDNFVLISGVKVKRRRCNIKHLQPLPQKLGVKKEAIDEEVINALVNAGLAEMPSGPVKQKKEAATQEPAAVEAPKKPLLSFRKPKEAPKPAEESAKKPQASPKPKKEAPGKEEKPKKKSLLGLRKAKKEEAKPAAGKAKKEAKGKTKKAEKK